MPWSTNFVFLIKSSLQPTFLHALIAFSGLRSAITETSKPLVLGTWLKNIEPNLPAPIRATFTGFLSSILFNIAFCKNILLPIN